MYVSSVTLKSVRGFDNLAWSLSSSDELAGWHVLVGPNGSGKSTFLRAIALALTGPKEAPAARLHWPSWVRTNAETAKIQLRVQFDPDWDNWSGKGNISSSKSTEISIRIDRDEGVSVSHSGSANRTVWGSGAGWFSVAYGPYRRFSGGDKANERIFFTHKRLGRHLSVFGEDVALTESLEWLKEIRFKDLEQRERLEPGQLAVSERSGEANSLSESIRGFINQDGFLPFGARLESVSSEGVSFVDGSGNVIPVLELSDGYRSVLSLTFELIRQLNDCYGPKRLFDSTRTKVICPGVVLIDEVDVHLHPMWQRSIGIWLTRHFPNLQFIVTTHSPFICQQVEPSGSLWRLPAPGSDESIRRFSGEALTRVVLGDVLEALNSDLFGGLPGRSDAAIAELEHVAASNRLRAASAGISADARSMEEVLRARDSFKSGQSDSE
ncbi:MAG: AAA family ATPase [Burkholderiaceae bacterium]